MTQKVALVTGAYGGLGVHVTKALLNPPGKDVTGGAIPVNGQGL